MHYDDTGCPILIPCPVCHGDGYVYYAYNRLTQEEKEVPEEDYFNLPDSREVAVLLGVAWMRGYLEKCPECYGSGEVDPDDYREYRDRCYRPGSRTYYW